MDFLGNSHKDFWPPSRGRGRGGADLVVPPGRAQEAGPGGVFSTILEKPWRVKAARPPGVGG